MLYATTAVAAAAAAAAAATATVLASDAVYLLVVCVCGERSSQCFNKIYHSILIYLQTHSAHSAHKMIYTANYVLVHIELVNHICLLSGEW